MKIHTSFPAYDNMLCALNEIYGLNLDKVDLYRDMIGSVYFLWENEQRYVYKLYRAFDTEAAIQATQIMDYLKSHDFPVVTIIPTQDDGLYSLLEMPEGSRVGILFEYVEGTEPDVNEDLLQIGELTGRMHRLMESYPGEVRALGKDFYIDRFVSIMGEMFPEPEKVAATDRYGAELWDRLSDLPQGFCHGDLHTGNLLKTSQGEIIFMDFDISAHSYSMFDVATICDDTDFWTVDEKDLEKTYRNFATFYAGYSKERQLSELEQAVIFDCIAIHHYELNGTIPLYRVPVEGNHWLNDRYFNLHYRWMMDWKKAKKIFE